MTAAAILTVAGLLAATPVGASQEKPTVPTGSHIPRAPGTRDINTYTYSREESDREFAAYSNCIVEGRAGQRDAMTFLRLVPNTAVWAKAGQKLTSPNCLRTAFGQMTMRFKLDALRPALFAAMYRRQYAKVVPTNFADVPPLEMPKLYDGPVEGFPPQALAQLSFGNCVARSDAQAVHRLLVTRPWSDAEDAALPAVSKAMGGCLPQDQKLRMSRSTVRGVVAEAMYHLASARAGSVVVADAAATKGR